MRRASARIGVLRGLDRNRVGDADDLAPDHLLNLLDARGGGYTPAGAWAGSPDAAINSYPNFVGSDALGLASVRSGAVGSPAQYRYGLVRDGSFVAGSLAGGEGAGSHYGAHIPGVGAYASIDRFLVQDRLGNIVEPGDFASSGDFNPPSVGGATGLPVVSQALSFDAKGVDYSPLLGRWLVYGGELGEFLFAYRDGADGAWVEPAPLVLSGGQRPISLARTASSWVVVGTGGLVLRSADGVTWIDESFGGHNFTSVTADPDSTNLWASVTEASVDGNIWASADNGETWANLALPRFYETTSGGNERWLIPWGVAYIPDDNAIAYLRAHWSVTGSLLLGLSFEVWEFDSGAVRVFDYSTPGGGTGSSSSLTFMNYGWDRDPTDPANADNFRIRLSSSGEVALVFRSLPGYVDPPPPGSAGRGRVYMVSYLADHGNASWDISDRNGVLPPSSSVHGWGDAVWLNGEWVAAGEGSNYGRGTRQMPPTAAPEASWSFGDFGSGAFMGMATDGSIAMAVGASGLVAEWVPGGSSALGRYELIALTSVMTSAGKLVVSVVEDDFRIVEPQSRGVTSHSFDGTPPDFAGNVTTDVYVRFTPRVFDEELGQWVINEPQGGYTHVASLAGGGSWSVDSPGVGSQVLGISGGVAVASFRNSKGENVVAEHNARVWFQAGGSYSWSVLMGAFDFPMLEDERVVTFSVGGFVNLVELDGWLRLAATQSESLNGLLPSPQGLLVLFDNEVFALSGDVALNNLQALLFPDNVGLSTGCKAVLAGGVPITLWKGKLWALQGGQAQDVAAPVWRDDDPFVDVVSDPATRSVVALTDDGELLSLRTDTGFWFQLPAPSGSGALQRVVGHPDGFRVWLGPVLGVVTPWAFDPDASSPSVGEVAWLGLDAGDSLRRDNWLNVRFGIEGEGAAVPGAAPVVYYRPSDAGSTVPSVFTKNASYSSTGVRRGDEWWFQFPVGLKSRKLDVLFVFTGFGRAAVIEPGFDFTILPGHLEGRRAQLQ